MSGAATTDPSTYEALTTAAALVDRSERGKLALTGAAAAEALDGQVTNAVTALEAGRGCYAAFLTNKGKMLGDVRVLATGEELHLDCERSALQALFDILRRGLLGWDAELHKRTAQEGLLSLLGPRSAAVLEDAAVVALPEDEHDHVASTIAGAPVRVVRTDLGWDVLCAAEDTDRVRAALVDAGAVAVDEAAAEVVRVESGRPRYGIDLDDSVIPQEAGLNPRAVSFTKGCYVGQETVARLHYRGSPNRRLAGLHLAGPCATGDAVRLGEREVGRLGTVAESPRLGWIALAIVRNQAEDGAEVTVGDGATAAQVVPLPFA